MDYTPESNSEGQVPPESSPKPPQPQAVESRPSIPPIYIQMPAEKKRGGFWRFFWSFIFICSVLVNIVLFGALLVIAPMISAGGGEFAVETVLQEGNVHNKIAVVSIEGVINSNTANECCAFIGRAKQDPHVKGLILRVSSPGGGVTASDEIYNELKMFKQQTGKPVVAFMQGIAASGGYYTSVACDKIIAEPTTITGSIGVIMQTFELRELLEEKLGVKPVVIKSGPKKDWPSPFSEVTDEQVAYLQDTIIKPAYERFVSLVAAGRKDFLTADQVRKLADGSIYHAQQAVDNKLIDGIGYFDEAIRQVSLISQEKIIRPHVIEYRKPFRMSDFFMAESKSSLKLDRDTIRQMMTPELLFMWDGTN